MIKSVDATEPGPELVIGLVTPVGTDTRALGVVRPDAERDANERAAVGSLREEYQ